MRIVAFILDHKVVDQILQHLGRSAERRQRGPPARATTRAAS